MRNYMEEEELMMINMLCLQKRLQFHVTVTVLYEGVLSGDASGIEPSSFRIMR